MRGTKLTELKRRLSPGNVYRRKGLAQYSSNIDRHLKTLVDEGVLTKLRRGLYYCPKKSAFGDVPPTEKKLLKTFLNTDDFMVYSPNMFNALGLGMTQLYNMPVVLNPKRHGTMKVGGRKFLFLRKRFVPKRMTKEVLLVELLNNGRLLAEDHSDVEKALGDKLDDFDKPSLQKAASRYGTYSTQNKLNQLLEAP